MTTFGGQKGVAWKFRDSPKNSSAFASDILESAEEVFGNERRTSDAALSAGNKRYRKSATRKKAGRGRSKFIMTKNTPFIFDVEGASFQLENPFSPADASTFPEAAHSFPGETYWEHSRNIEHLQRDIHQREKENAQLREKNRHEADSVVMTELEKGFLSDLLQSTRKCSAYYDQQTGKVQLRGTYEHVSQRKLDLLVRKGQIQSVSLELSPAFFDVLCEEKGKRYLEAQLQGVSWALRENCLTFASLKKEVLDDCLLLMQKKLKCTVRREVKGKDVIFHVKSFLASNEAQKYLVVCEQSGEKEMLLLTWTGVEGDILSLCEKIDAIIQKRSIQIATFRPRSPSIALFFRKYLEPEVREQFGRFISGDSDTSSGFSLILKGNGEEVKSCLKKLGHMQDLIKSGTWELGAEFEDTDVELLAIGLRDELCQTEISEFEEQKKCLVLSNIQPARTWEASVSGEAFRATQTCQVILKSTGDITEELSDVLVCVLTEKLDARKTRVGRAFSRKCPSFCQQLKSQTRGHRSTEQAAVLVTKNNLEPLSCQAVVHIILSPWTGASGDTQRLQLSRAVHQTLVLTTDMGARSISFPPLGCGCTLKFPPDEAAGCLVKSIQNFLRLNPNSCLSEIVCLAPGTEYSQSLQECLTRELPRDDDSSVASRDTSQREMMPSGAPAITIVTRHEVQLSTLWTELKTMLSRICLHENYFHQKYLESWPDETINAIRKGSQELGVSAEISSHPIRKTRQPSYRIRGRKNAVQEMYLFIQDRFNDITSVVRPTLHEINGPKRYTQEFLSRASSVEERYPPYWFNRTPDPKRYNIVGLTMNAIAGVLTLTDPQRATGSDQTSSAAGSIQVTGILRLEAPRMFEKYAHNRKRLFQSAVRQRSCLKKPDLISGKLQSTESLPGSMKNGVYGEVNEYYLIHVCSERSLDTWLASGRYPQQRDHGVSFWSDPKAALCHAGPQVAGNVWILARVLLGHIYVNTRKKEWRRPPCIECGQELCRCNTGLYDSVVTHTPEGHLKLTVYDVTACYPEYIATVTG
ncbi:uncharacterized protein LOC101855752 [Aplysia californica]|uniref:Uncharacterized protein LOC101855752 n=1 Tax=Aplysia californica TaxID=6500 RepID=A0ABM0K508_APLCA|nr:uncharacterized protein LOC101855752 [Aplysia californica]